LFPFLEKGNKAANQIIPETIFQGIFDFILEKEIKRDSETIQKNE
jgi:hypothetical protein